MKTTPDNIRSLEPHQIFVFGSNLAGKHGLGAARTAWTRFDAQWGIGTGPTGRCYAIATKDKRFKQMPLHKIEKQIWDFLVYAQDHPELEFLVTQIGCGLAGFKPEQIAPLFFNAGPIPEKVVLPQSFWDTQKKPLTA